jgi:hypothetical protein
MVWHQSTVATKSLAMKTIIKDAYAKTGEPFSGSPVVNFGVRRSTGGPMGGLHASSAALGGFAHLMVSSLSDNVPALHFSRYGPGALTVRLRRRIPSPPASSQRSTRS